MANNLLMQFQADNLGVPLERPVNIETTAMGAAYLAGLAVGFWEDKNELKAKYKVSRRFLPEMAVENREKLYKGWQRAVTRARDWETEE